MLEMRVQLNIWTKATRRFVMKIYKSFREISDGDFCWILRIWEKQWWRFLKCRNIWVFRLKYFNSAATQKCSKSKTIQSPLTKSAETNTTKTSMDSMDPGAWVPTWTQQYCSEFPCKRSKLIGLNSVWMEIADIKDCCKFCSMTYCSQLTFIFVTDLQSFYLV